MARWDVIIVGGGPAGLSAALILGRCRRRVLLFDDGRPRNWAARRTHGYLTRDGIPPERLRRLGRRELAAYDVTIRDETVESAARRSGGLFSVKAGRHRDTCRAIILATGVEDRLPEVEGAERLYGRGVFHCPYCDGWEVRDRRLAMLARGASGVEAAAGLTTWSRDVVLVTDGWNRFTRAPRAALDTYGVALRTEPLARLDTARCGGSTSRTASRSRAMRSSSTRARRSAAASRRGSAASSIAPGASSPASSRASRAGFTSSGTHLATCNS